MKWTITIQKPGSHTGLTLDGRASSPEEAARSAVEAGRAFANARGVIAVNAVVTFDGALLRIKGALDPAISTDTAVRQVLLEFQRITTPSKDAPHVKPSIEVATETSDERDIETLLTRIAAIVRSHLGRDPFEKPSRIDLEHLQEQWEVRFTDELGDLFSHSNGSDITILPAHDLLSVERSGQIRAMWLDIMTDHRERIPDFAEAFDPAVLNADPAGTPSELFLPTFVPIADRDGSTLVVDTRAGELHGCVLEYTAEGATESGVQWRSVTSLLSQLCMSLEAGTAMQNHRATITSAGIAWTKV